jgi:phage repressor protein C with HTH and peptisase S24 domain
MAMLTHAQIWAALDRLADRSGLSASALARKAGLDPTTFNRSKRVTAEGRQRWPSTESLAKSLEATNTSFEAFVQLIDPASRGEPRQAIPLLSLDEAAQGHFDQAGLPAGTGWDTMAFPAINDPRAYALEVSAGTLAPAYRDNTVIVVSPAAAVRRGDRVVLMTTSGEIMVREIKRRSTKTIELQSVTGSAGLTLTPRDVQWMHRVVWASQ